MKDTGQKLYRHAKTIIPGGTQLLSKRPELFLPDHWPSYYRRAKGIEVWDLDGKKYIDMTHTGVGACILGMADPDVNRAVVKAIGLGSMSTLNCPEEVELAELLLALHPWAEMVRFARSGGESMAMAVRIARAATGRDLLAFCGYHGWHDWYLSANLADEKTLDGHLLPGLEPVGVPRGLRKTLFPFRYNHIEDLEKIIAHHGKKLAAIVMEPVRNTPQPDFLQKVRRLADQSNTVLIFDEVTSGFRLCTGGAHLTLGVQPDMAAFAKGMSNGYPMAAVIGTRAVMSAAQKSFISSTYWTERIGPVAALATIRKHKRLKVHQHLIHIGTLVQKGWETIAKKAELTIAVSGIPPLSHFSITGPHGRAAHTLFTQLMLEEGFLASGTFYPTFAHTENHVDRYLKATERAFEVIANALRKGSVEKLLRGPIAHAEFKRLT